MFKSKFPIFPALVWAATAGKIGSKRQRLVKQNVVSILQNIPMQQIKKSKQALLSY